MEQLSTASETYNPSHNVKAVLLNRVLLVLGFVGLFISGFLSLAHILNADVPCGRSGGCEMVTKHPSGIWFGVPVAIWGFGGYLILTALASIRAMKGLEATRGLVMPGYFVAAAGTVGSLYLQYVALFQIHATCYWCLSSAIVMVLTLIVYAMLAQTLEDHRSESVPADSKGFSLATGLAAATILGLAIGMVVLKSGPKGTDVKIDPKQARMEALIPKDAHVFGDPNAKITVVEFADMYCPACRRASPKLKELIAKNPGKIRMVYRHFPLMDKHPLALNAALISEVAADQGKFFDYLIAVMKREGTEEIGVPALYEVASEVGVDVDEAKKRMQNEKDPIYARVQRDIALSDRLGLQVTPTFILMLDGKITHIASSNDFFETLQASPYKEILGPQQ
jgi:protein-disulfide isomerase